MSIIAKKNAWSEYSSVWSIRELWTEHILPACSRLSIAVVHATSRTLHDHVLVFMTRRIEGEERQRYETPRNEVEEECHVIGARGKRAYALRPIDEERSDQLRQHRIKYMRQHLPIMFYLTRDLAGGSRFECSFHLAHDLTPSLFHYLGATTVGAWLGAPNRCGRDGLVAQLQNKPPGESGPLLALLASHGCLPELKVHYHIGRSEDPAGVNEYLGYRIIAGDPTVCEELRALAQDDPNQLDEHQFFYFECAIRSGRVQMLDRVSEAMDLPAVAFRPWTDEEIWTALDSGPNMATFVSRSIKWSPDLLVSLFRQSNHDLLDNISDILDRFGPAILLPAFYLSIKNQNMGVNLPMEIIDWFRRHKLLTTENVETYLRPLMEADMSPKWSSAMLISKAATCQCAGHRLARELKLDPCLRPFTPETEKKAEQILRRAGFGGEHHRRHHRRRPLQRLPLLPDEEEDVEDV
jgi:hypothetical protein